MIFPYAKHIFLIAGLYFLTLLQTSFLVHFIKTQTLFNLVLILIAVLAFFEKRESGFGFFAALWAGFFLDIFSNVFIGFHISIAVFMVALIKLFVKRYVYLPQIS